jgi:hypothetical protein
MGVSAWIRTLREVDQREENRSIVGRLSYPMFGSVGILSSAMPPLLPISEASKLYPGLQEGYCVSYTMRAICRAFGIIGNFKLASGYRQYRLYAVGQALVRAAHAAELYVEQEIGLDVRCL